MFESWAARVLAESFPRTPPEAVDVRWACPSPRCGSRGVFRRAARLTPYVAETIVEDALRAGPGAHLELTVSADAPPSALAPLHTRLARLARRGVHVHIQRWRPAVV